MNLSLQLTLYGLVKALRWKAHGLAEDVDRRYVRAARGEQDDVSAGPRAVPMREARDDRIGQ